MKIIRTIGLVSIPFLLVFSLVEPARASLIWDGIWDDGQGFYGTVSWTLPTENSEPCTNCLTAFSAHAYLPDPDPSLTGTQADWDTSYDIDAVWTQNSDWQFNSLTITTFNADGYQFELALDGAYVGVTVSDGGTMYLTSTITLTNDHVVVPEPSTIWLFLIGLLAFTALTLRSPFRRTGRGFLRRLSPALGV